MTQTQNGDIGTEQEKEPTKAVGAKIGVSILNQWQELCGRKARKGRPGKKGKRGFSQREGTEAAFLLFLTLPKNFQYQMTENIGNSAYWDAMRQHLHKLWPEIESRLPSQE